LLSLIAAAPINHVLRGESWALRRLQKYAGRTAKFDVTPFAFAFTVCESGEVRSAAAQTPIDTEIRVRAATALRIASGDKAAYREVEVSGDLEFAQAIEFVVRNARWDAEEDLARVMGDVLAHRTVQSARSLANIPRAAARSLGRNLADYLIEEKNLLASRQQIESFAQEVDRLRDDSARLTQRIEQLRNRSPRT
jgi:ubiquinone biosynthesis protein UbiJ